MIYQGKQIYCIIDDDLEKGDVGYIERKDIPDTISKVAFLLSDVTMWQSYNDSLYPFTNREPKVAIKFKYSPNIVLIENIDAFTELMHEYEASRFIQFRQQ